MGETILCVDDDRQILTLYKAILQESGYQVLIEANGQDGLAAYDRCRVDCVVLDYQMSDLNGAEFVQEMFFRHSSTPVILISGSSALPPELLARVHAFVEKPISMQRLLDCVENLIGKARRRPTEQAVSAVAPARSLPSNQSCRIFEGHKFPKELG
jgi:two-component system chemotaxis response regulator CheY